MVKIASLVKAYSDGGRVGPITLSVKNSEVYGLVGPNGSGKTTTLRAMLGLLTPTSGSVEVFGVDPFSEPKKVNARVGYSPEIPTFPPFFTARKLLEVTCKLKGMNAQETKREVERVLDLTGLVNHAERKVASFSKGMVQRLSIGQALVGDPELLVLDEPMLGVDPVGRVHMREVLIEQRKEGKTIVFSSHELYEVERISDRVGMVYMGNTVLEGSVSDLLRSQDGRSVVEVVVKRRPNDEVRAAILRISGVKSLNVGDNSIWVELDNAHDPREEIAEVLVRSGCGLIEMRLVPPTLEDVFVRVVKQGVNS
ncbi:MAG: ABC transporter ATP-binding protein [Thaumarchaeota archaeon]|nr:ABC transporter ATP-binding protein [Candidatus Calditenuaceae archaeon]MDW8187063.1 ABC transporter ATP-binding protein [Nitrososphaerota archaeon]